MPARKPGHREGVRRFQRYGQTTLDVGSTLDERFRLSENEEAEILAFTGTCQSCGRYLDVRQHQRCPSPCDGYIG